MPRIGGSESRVACHPSNAVAALMGWCADVSISPPQDLCPLLPFFLPFLLSLTRITAELAFGVHNTEW